MEAVKGMISALCVSMIFFGIVLMLAPNGSIQKSFKCLLSVALVSVMIAVVTGAEVNIGDFDFERDVANSYQMSSELNKTVGDLNASVTDIALKTLIEERLSAFGIDDVEISVEKDISEDNSISITKVRVICNYGDGEVCRREVGALGFDVEVTERYKQ